MNCVLGVDHGDRRIGLAVAREGTTVAVGLETLVHSGWKDLRAGLTRIVEAEEPDRIVVGYPLEMDGTPGPRCEAVEQFARRIVGWFGLPVVLWDERLTSREAERVRLEAGISERKARGDGLVDRASAVLLLQNWLDSADRAGIPWDPHARSRDEEEDEGAV